MFDLKRLFNRQTGLVGCVVEFHLPIGYVYGLCTHDLNKEGQILKMFKSIYSSSMVFDEAILGDDLRMHARFPLKYAMSEPDIKVIGKARLSKQDQVMPKFRSLGLAKKGEMPKGWWIIDGDSETWVTSLNREMSFYSEDGFPSLPILNEYYAKDLYPFSKELMQKGPLNFSPDRMN
ncbi:MAG: hypothetical protein AAF826_01735 [Pseudomonadota bacterium]